MLASSLPQLRLPDDNTQSMKLMFSILHQRHDLVPAATPPQELACVARLADKYNCVSALKYAAAFYNHALTDTQIADSPVNTIKAAYIFNDAAQFAKATDLAVTQCFSSRIVGFGSTPNFDGLEGQ